MLYNIYMKQINEQQIKLILDELMKLNIPVQIYVGLQKLFTDLPPVETKK